MKACRLLLLSVLLLGFPGCGESDAATLASTLDYKRDGGFAGIIETVAIRPDGRATVDGGEKGRRTVKLSKDELQRVARLVREADLPAVKVPKSDGGFDTYAYTFRYRGRTLKFDDTVFPEDLTKLVSELNRLVKRYGGGIG